MRTLYYLRKKDSLNKISQLQADYGMEVRYQKGKELNLYCDKFHLALSKRTFQIVIWDDIPDDEAFQLKEEFNKRFID